MTETALIELKGITKKFEGSEGAVVKNLSLNVRKGEFLTLLGPSGCGKTTTLRMIAGFEQPTAGSIVIDDEDITNILPHERCVNTVFQNYALFPHMNIFDNIAFGLKMKKVNKEEIKQRVTNMLKMIQLQGFENRMPNQLSGGQMQRVAIARAVINNPKVLLLDEPLGALDFKLRKTMQLELKQLQKSLGITFIFVTHDQEEALTMSDRIAVMKDGIIEQLGTPEDIYEKPKSEFVAGFIGETNILQGTVISSEKNTALLKLKDSEQTFKVSKTGLKIGEALSTALRPERIKVKSCLEQEDVCLQGKIKDRIYTGTSFKTIVELDNGKLITVNEPAGEEFRQVNEASPVYISWNIEKLVVMEA